MPNMPRLPFLSAYGNPMIDGWEVLGDNLVSSQESTDDMASQLEVPVDEVEHDYGPEKIWWAELLIKHARELQMQIPTLTTPVTVISGCSGAFAEGFVMEEIELSALPLHCY